MRYTPLVRKHYSEFRFDGEPSDSIRRVLRRYGYRPDPATGVWSVNRATGYGNCRAAIDLLLRKECGIPSLLSEEVLRALTSPGLYRKCTA